MKYIEGIRVKNYRVLRDVSLGSVLLPPETSEIGVGKFHRGERLTPLTVVIGRNGFGKSTLFDAFGFIVDSLQSGVELACNSRGGFDRIVSQGSDRILEFEIRYGDILYTLCVAADEYNVPFVHAETLAHIQPKHEAPSMNFFAKAGEGKVVKSNTQSVDDIHLADKRRLVLSTLGNLSQYPDIVAFRQFLDSWYLSFFSPDAARKTPSAGPQKHLSSSGDNLANVVQYMEREHKERFKEMLDRIGKRILGVGNISTRTTEDGRLLLCFFERGLEKPLYADQMSDGTLKLVAYMLLLGDPEPPPFVCFEEPENGLYHKLLAAFVDEIRTYSGSGAQFFITTHQPYLVDVLNPKEVWILEKGSDGFASIRRAGDDPIVRGMVEGGLPLGALWYSEYLEGDGT